MNKYLKPILLILLVITLSSCGEKKCIQTMSRPTPQDGHEETLRYMYTGEYCLEKNYYNIPYMVIIENSKDARPQSGLNDADIVYETMAEGGIPRFIALYHKISSKKIGPVRSLRPCFIDISKEYNLPFAHCGGSDEALNIACKENLMSMNEMTYGPYFFRDTTRKAPHNLYTSSEKLLSLIKDTNYSYTPKHNLIFDGKYWDNLNLQSASIIELKLNRYYSTSYTFNNGDYYKSMDKVPSIDKETQLPISAKNIIIQITKIKLQKDNLHIDINLVGEGDGFVTSNGRFVKMKWSKKDVNSPTILVDEKGQVIPLSPGKTWWHIVDLDSTINIL